MCATEMLKDLKIDVDGDCYTVSGRFEWSLTVCQDQAPDQVQREVDRMGQLVKRQVYGGVLEEVDCRIVQQWQLANGDLQKRGCRPFSFVTPFGTVAVRRTRVWDRRRNCWHVPSAVAWDTPHRKYIVPGLREAAMDEMREHSARKAERRLSQQAHEPQLLGVSTIVKVMHEEGNGLVNAQRQRALNVLKEDPQAVKKGLATWPDELVPAPDVSANCEASCEVAQLDNEEPVELSAGEEQEVMDRAVGFLEPSAACSGISADKTSDESCSTEPAKRIVDAGRVLVQPDEVKTKAQASQDGKENWTYTATIQVDERTCYLAESSAADLSRLVAAWLCCLGVLGGVRQLLVIGDGATWIRRWFEGLKLPGKEMVLCWFHLAKRVYQRLSASGFSKERRQAIEHEVLSHLWQGDLAGAVWVLWGVREEARQPKWIEDLIRYLLRRRVYLPDYGTRHRARLWIASNRVEKWNDWAVSNRCKRRGMSWTEEGVLSLATHESADRNNELKPWRRTHELAQAT